MFLQSQCKSRVCLVETLLPWQALSWFALVQFEKRLLILNSFELFLTTFIKALEKYDKIHWTTSKINWATTKIRSLRQGARSTSIYASNFRQLAFDINWDKHSWVNFNGGYKMTWRTYCYFYQIQKYLVRK